MEKVKETVHTIQIKGGLQTRPMFEKLSLSLANELLYLCTNYLPRSGFISTHIKNILAQNEYLSLVELESGAMCFSLDFILRIVRVIFGAKHLYLF